MAPIEDIRSYVLRRSTGVPKVLLILGGPFSNAIGDTVNFANHPKYPKYLTAILGPSQITIWSTDVTVWRALCGDGIVCTPFIAEAQAVHGFDLIVFDWVPVDQSLERLYSGSSTALIEIARHAGWVRYRTGTSKWRLFRLPPGGN